MKKKDSNGHHVASFLARCINVGCFGVYVVSLNGQSFNPPLFSYIYNVHMNKDK